MKKAIKALTLLATVIFMSSFTKKNAHLFVGTYGVSASDPSAIKLTINSDHTFYYQDFSVSEQKIVVNGRWNLKGNKVVLTENNAKKKFHHVWTFVDKGQVAKSRKGLTYYRLCKINQ